MKRIIFTFLFFSYLIKAQSIDLYKMDDLPETKPESVDSFYYMMAGAVVPTRSPSLGHLFYPLPEISFGRRKMGLWHDWDYCVGARIGSHWEEFYLQSSYLFRPIRKFGGYVGFGGRLGGYHSKTKQDDQLRHAFGYYSEFLFHLGYEFFDIVPGFAQLQISSDRNAVIGYGFGF